MDIQEILITSGISAAAVLILVNLFPSIFTHILSRDLERHKHSLDLIKNRDNMLYEERAKVIKKLYENMNYLNSHLKSFAMFKSDLEKKKNYMEIFLRLFSEFQVTFSMSRLYFPEPICARIEAFIENIQKLNGNMIWMDEYSNKEFIAKLTEEEKKNNQAMYDIMKGWFDEANKNIPPIQKDIEREFREMLGVQ